MYWIPTMLILSVYAIVQYIARTKGDWDDRVKLRAQADKERAEARKRALESLEEEAAERRRAPDGAAGGSGGSPGESIEDAKAFMRSGAKRIAGGSVPPPAEASAGEAAGVAADGAVDEDKLKAKAKQRTRSKLTTSLKLRQDERVTFADVAGIGEAKQELMEVCSPPSCTNQLSAALCRHAPV